MSKPTLKLDFKFGDTAEDVLTGFSGVVGGFTTYISGCDQYLLYPRVDKDGVLRKAEWFDVKRLVAVKAEPVPVASTRRNGPGVPAPVR